MNGPMNYLGEVDGWVSLCIYTDGAQEQVVIVHIRGSQKKSITPWEKFKENKIRNNIK